MNVLSEEHILPIWRRAIYYYFLQAPHSQLQFEKFCPGGQLREYFGKEKIQQT